MVPSRVSQKFWPFPSHRNNRHRISVTKSPWKLNSERSIILFSCSYLIFSLGAQAALIRLMDSYEITVDQLSEGIIPGIKQTIHKLTAKDCHDISDIAHKSRRYVRMKQWSEHASMLINDASRPLRHGNVTRYILTLLWWGILRCIHGGGEVNFPLPIAF